MRELELRPLDRPPDVTVRVPGSKSVTNRALVLAALSSRYGPCQLLHPLRSDDTEIMVAALRQLGYPIRPADDWSAIEMEQHAGPLVPATSAELFLGNSGTSVRFLTALVALGTGRYRIDGVPRMRERPIGDLLTALRSLGVDAESEAGTECPPVVVTANGLAGGDVSIRGGVSSQFLSAVLMVAPFTPKGMTVRVEGPLVSEPYVEMTVRQMAAWGLIVVRQSPGEFVIPPQPPQPPAEYAIEPDASAASYFLAAAAVTGGRVTVTGIPADSLQGDVAFADLLGRMGCRVERSADGITITGGPLVGIDADMNAISDTVMTLAAVACFAAGPTTIRNVAHVRHKETDRLAAMANELRRLGAAVDEFADGLTVTPQPLRGTAVDTYQDHRMAMSLAVIGLRIPGVVVRDPNCVAKTYPEFFADWERLRG